MGVSTSASRESNPLQPVSILADRSRKSYGRLLRNAKDQASHLGLVPEVACIINSRNCLLIGLLPSGDSMVIGSMYYRDLRKGEFIATTDPCNVSKGWGALCRDKFIRLASSPNAVRYTRQWRV